MKDYKKILEGVVNIINTTEKSDIGFTNICTYIGENFPELKESEDEKIRKEIVEAVELHKDFTQERKEHIYAWLEKQGNCYLSHDDEIMIRQLTEYFTTGHGLQNTNGTVVAWLNDVKEKLEKQGEHAKFRDSIQVGDKVTRNEDGVLVNLSQLKRVATPAEEQCEQKLADKIEPKFKVKKGEWYVCTNTFVSKSKIIAIKGQTYQSKQEDDTITCEDNCLFIDRHDGKASEYFRLWTIQDAKDGDVLAEDSCIFIIQKLNDNNTAKTYCTLYDDGDFDDGTILYFDIDSTKPATKEQCDLLFAKMAEAGYQWNAEKRELKKIEQKPAWSEKHIADVFEKVGLAKIVREQSNDNLTNALQNAMIELSKFTSQPKQEWSEEDEKYSSYICAALECYYRLREDRNNTNGQEDLDKARNWLYNKVKTLRPQKQWKPSEEQINALFRVTQYYPYNKEILNSLYEQLKTL